MYYFIINPNSKSGKGSSIWHQIQHQLNTHQISYQAIHTMYSGHATKLIKQLCSSSKPKTVIVLGGDGTLSEVIQGLSVPNLLTIGYIPTGSGNDFARSLQLNASPLKLLSHLLHSTTIVEIDYGTFTFHDGTSHRFAVSCGIGFDAMICKKSANSSIKKLLNHLHLGSLSYLFIGIPTIFTRQHYRGTLVLDDMETISIRNLFFASIHIHPFEGGGFAFCPNAHYADGALDICIVEAKWIPKRILILLATFLKKHEKLPGVHIYRCQKAHFSFQHSIPLHMDGDCPETSVKTFTVSASPKDHFRFLS